MRCDQKMKSNIFAQKNKPICGRFILKYHIKALICVYANFSIYANIRQFYANQQ